MLGLGRVRTAGWLQRSWTRAAATRSGWPAAGTTAAWATPCAKALCIAVALVAGPTLTGCSDGPEAATIGVPVRVGNATYNVADAHFMEWMPIVPDHPEVDPSVWRPKTVHVRELGFVPDDLGDADLWVRVRLDVFSDDDPFEIYKDDLVLIGADGREYRAVFVQDVSRGEDQIPSLVTVVNGSTSELLLRTAAYPHDGPGSFATVRVVYAVPEGAVDGAELRLSDQASSEERTIDLGLLPEVRSESAPRHYE
ncbi:MAG: hypothetical protein ACK2T6_07335 [Anaerolineae bacterium]